jgi:myo-inositol catabolism protein IolC
MRARHRYREARRRLYRSGARGRRAEGGALADDRRVGVGVHRLAVGRTTAWDAVAAYVGKRATQPAAVSRIAQRYREWTAIFTWEQAP